MGDTLPVLPQGAFTMNITALKIRDEAKSIAEDIMDDRTRDEWDAFAHKWAAGHEWIIYTHNAWNLVNAARSDASLHDAGYDLFEDRGGMSGLDHIDTVMTRLAYCILVQAIQDQLGANQ